MEIDLSNYECDRCGACCKTFIVEAEYVDAVREPRLFEIAPVDLTLLREGSHAIMLGCRKEVGSPLVCQFFDEMSGCGIYPTRPNACVAFEAGSEQCQYARHRHGMDVLLDKHGNPPSEEVLRELMENWDE